MKGLTPTLVGLVFTLAVSAPALALTPRPPPPPRAPPPCCHVRAGTVVDVALVDDVSTKVVHTGDSFGFRLAAPVIVNGLVVLRAGTLGRGTVVEAARPGMGGKPAKLVLSADYLVVRGGRIPLQGLQLSAAGKDNSMAANAVGLSGIAFGPLGFIGLAVKGGNVDFQPGTSATAKLAQDMNLTALGRATRADFAAVDRASRNDAPDATTGSIALPPPPRGMGQVVFFRPKTLMGTAQWFNVRENGDALGKLSNGAYFVQVTQPGQHTYSAVSEPELKDKLTLEVDPGETYFVEGGLDKGLVMTAADLTPSNQAAFNKASKDLKLAPPPEPGKPDNLDQYPDANAPAHSDGDHSGSDHGGGDDSGGGKDDLGRYPDAGGGGGH